jgi:hypothetical protein
MLTISQFRSLMIGAFAFGLLAGLGVRAYAVSSDPGRGPQQHVAPIERRAPGAGTGPQMRPRPKGAMGGANGEHLPQWMNQHSGMTLEQQQDALQREPGFRELPMATQQRMFNRLSQLHAMTPRERQRIMERNEAMERLSPYERSEVRGAMEQLGSLPPDQRAAVARSFRSIRTLPPPQRLAAMNSMEARSLNYQQRTILTNLIRVAPMLPPPEPPQPR